TEIARDQRGQSWTPHQCMYHSPLSHSQFLGVDDKQVPGQAEQCDENDIQQNVRFLHHKLWAPIDSREECTRALSDPIINDWPGHELRRIAVACKMRGDSPHRTRSKCAYFPSLGKLCEISVPSGLFNGWALRHKCGPDF